MRCGVSHVRPFQRPGGGSDQAQQEAGSGVRRMPCDAGAWHVHSCLSGFQPLAHKYAIHFDLLETQMLTLKF